MIDIAGLIDWFIALLTREQWDLWRNWLATLVGAGGLVIVIITFRSNLRLRRIDQARLVFATATADLSFADDVVQIAKDDKTSVVTTTDVATPVPGAPKPDDKTYGVAVHVEALRVELRVHNGSKERIGPVIVEAYNLSEGQAMPEATYTCLHLDPESDVTAIALFANPQSGRLPSVGATLRFQDASGRSWKRHLLEPVKPGNKLPTSNPKGRYWELVEPTPEGGQLYIARLDEPKNFTSGPRPLP